MNFVHSYHKKIILTILLILAKSSDSTSHHSINYNSLHVNIIAETYSTDGMMEIKGQVTQLLGIHSSVEGTSEQAIKYWDAIFSKMIEIYDNSPLGQSLGTLVQLIDIFMKLLKMHSDHCSKERKDFKGKRKVWLIRYMEKIKSLNSEMRSYCKANDETTKAASGKGKCKSFAKRKKMFYFQQ